jgi:glycosyltransferase involved in cell wall biosynthesis
MAVWVNTIGTRTPKLDLATLRRGLDKILQWLWRSKSEPDKSRPEGLRVINPRMWPWFTRGFDRRFNMALLLRQLGPVVSSLPETPIAVATLPIIADLMGHLPVRRWVYYCVDDFSRWPGLDGKTLGRMEDLVVGRADVLVAASEKLRERLAAMGRTDAHLLTHGVDLEFWRDKSSSAPPAGLDDLERPLVVFWGVIDRRMDTPLLRKLTVAMTKGTVILTGPKQDPDPELRRLPRTVHLGPLPFYQLPALAREAAVLVMPYADLPVTRAMQPLKLKEYLATGLPVVARDLPANREWSRALDLVSGPDGFVEAVRHRLETGLPPHQRAARAALESEGWDTKARQFAAWALCDEPAPGGAFQWRW